jgi:transposase
MWYVGVDFHQRMSCICILNKNGGLIKEEKVVGDWSVVMAELARIKKPFAVCYEASWAMGHLHDQLVRIAKRVVVAHPGGMTGIYNTKRKNDRIDARKLAIALMLNQVPAVHVPREAVRFWRRLIEFRQRLIGRRTQVKNAIRALLRGLGVTARPGKGLWTAKGRAWLAALDLPEEAGLQRDLLLDELEGMKPRIDHVEAFLKKRADAHPGVRLLRTIPGVGIRTAEAVAAYIDDPRRFSKNKSIGRYFGLIPCEDTSVKQRLGHITRDGPGTVRKLLTEAAWQAVRRSPAVRARYERIKGVRPQRNKIAIVAIAHYLARVMLSMLRSQETWCEEPETTRAVA